MLSLGRRHLLSLVVGGATVSSYVLYRGYESDFDIYNVGAARFGRAAVTVSRRIERSLFHAVKMIFGKVGAIGLDYKRTLRDFADEDSRRTDAYQQALSACHQRSADKLLQLCRDNGGCFVKVKHQYLVDLSVTSVPLAARLVSTLGPLNTFCLKNLLIP